MEIEVLPFDNTAEEQQTMRAKSQKRLVSRGRYLYLSGKRMSLTFLHKFSYCAAVLCGLAYILGMNFLFDSLWVNILFILASASLAGILFIMSLRFSAKLSLMEDVLPITQENVSILSSGEILVRSSEAPLSPQQAELLRATPQGSETSPQELLRATNSGQETS